MTILYCRASCPRCTSVREALEELAIECRIVQVAPGAPMPEGLPAGARLPVLIDEGEAYLGSGAVLDHLEELRLFKEDWYRFQSDACYCDEEDVEARPPDGRVE
jgi:glutathione S-transferase